MAEEKKTALERLAAEVFSSEEIEHAIPLLFDERSTTPDDYNVDYVSIADSFERQAAKMAAQRAEASGLIAQLEEQTHARRQLLVRNSRRYRSWPLCELVLEKAFDLGPRDPSVGVEWAETGLAIAEQLRPEEYGDRIVKDFQGRAWTVLGGVLRICSKLKESERAFAKAAKSLEEGTGDPLENGHHSRMLGALRLDQGRYDEACQNYDHAIRLYRLIGETHLAARATIDKAITLGESGETARAIELTRQGLEHIDGTREPRMVLVAKHNLVLLLEENGELQEAVAGIEEVRRLHQQLGNAIDMLRLRWLEGKLNAGLGLHNRAEREFQEVQEAFVEKNIPYDAALVSLDIATLYLEQGRTAEIKRLATEMLPIFQILDIHREALAALALFQKAAQMEQVSISLVQQLARYLETAEGRPGVKFEPSKS